MFYFMSLEEGYHHLIRDSDKEKRKNRNDLKEFRFSQNSYFKNYNLHADNGV